VIKAAPCVKEVPAAAGSAAAAGTLPPPSPSATAAAAVGGRCHSCCCCCGCCCRCWRAAAMVTADRGLTSSAALASSSDTSLPRSDRSLRNSDRSILPLSSASYCRARGHSTYRGATPAPAESFSERTRCQMWCCGSRSGDTFCTLTYGCLQATYHASKDISQLHHPQAADSLKCHRSHAQRLSVT
jgi:hypothetical protein